MELSTLRIFPTREKRRQVLGLLRSVQGPTQAEPHCLACRIYEEDGYQEAILYLEWWDSEERFEGHVTSDLYRRVLEAMELSRIPPEMSFHRVAETRGMELIEALRGSKEHDAAATPSKG